MALTQAERALVIPATINAPTNSVGFDVSSRTRKDYGSFAKLEAAVHADLTSTDPKRVHQGVVTVFAWGLKGGNHAQLGRRFEALVGYDRADKYLLAGHVFRLLDGTLSAAPYLHLIRGLELPGYIGGMSYVSKLRSFLTPARYVVLDRVLLNKLRNPGGAHPGNVLDRAHFDPRPRPAGLGETSIKIDDQNEEVYTQWSRFCERVAAEEFAGQQIHGRSVLAADVERGFYALAKDDAQAPQARAILNAHAPA